MEENYLARFLIEGDKHFDSKNYGGHRDYPNETLHYDNEINKLMRELGVTHYINTGDLSYGSFHSLDYRTKIDQLLEEKRKIVGDNFWIVKGNHDRASSGTTEYEYYTSKGAFKSTGCIDIGIGTPGGGLHIELKGYGEKTAFTHIESAFNLIIGHGLYSMKNDGMPNYGEPNIQLDDFQPWAGVDMIIAGHIHNEHLVKGKICGKEIAVHYLPCLSRPAYIRDGMPDKGTVDIITVYESGKVEIEPYQIPLLPLNVSFDLAAIQRKDEEKELKEHTKVDVADVAKRLEEHVRVANDPLSAIEHMENIEEEVRQVAAELLKEASN